MNDPFQFATNNALSPGQLFFDRYTLVKFLGRGGMGQVWLVKDGVLGEEIALKFLPSEIMADRAALEDLKRETLRSRKLSHPNIVKVYDFATGNGMGAISMEYVSGGTLADARYDMPGAVLDATDPRFAIWMIQLASALSYAHEDVGIVHRDLKPQNLMLDGQGNLKLADFGVARSLTDSMSRLSRQNAGSSGTHIYMSPQQAQGMAPSASDDIYAFGATVYDLLTGKPPFFRGNIQHQIDSVEPEPMNQRRAELVEDIELPVIPEYWEDLVTLCLKKLPTERPATMREIGEHLVFWSKQPFQAGPPPIREQPQPGPPPINLQSIEAAENARLAEEARMRDESERHETEKQRTEAIHRRVGDSASSEQEALAKRAAALPIEKLIKKFSPLSWIIAACAIMGFVGWAVISFNKPPQTRTVTVTVTEDAAIQRNQDTAETTATQAKEAEQLAAKAEQEKQLLTEQAQAREDAAKHAEERQRLADLAQKEKLARIAQVKAKEDTTLNTTLNLSDSNPTTRKVPPVVPTKVAKPETTSTTKTRPPESDLALKYLDAALGEVKDFRDPSQYIEALCKIAEAKSKVGEIEASRTIFGQLKKWALTLPTGFTQPSVVALARIAQSESQAGDRDAARNTLKEAEAKLAENDDIFSRSMAISRIGEAQMVIGDTKDALITFELAEKTAAKLKGHSKNWCLIENLIIRAKAEAQSGNGEAARQTLLNAIVSTGAMKADLLAKIAQVQAEVGDVAGAKKTFSRALDFALHMKDTYEKGSTLKDLAIAQASSGDITGANSTAAQIKDKYEGGNYTYKDESLAAIKSAASASATARFMSGIKQQAKDGGATTAESAVKQLTTAEDRSLGYIQIANGLLEE